MTYMRILCVAVFGLFVVNVNGAQAPQTQTTIFDLPADTPGLMTDKQNQSVCGKTKECVHVIVPGTAAERALKREYYDDIIEATANNGNIYFPSDGTQPTTEEAVEYSCANVKNDAITDWYMKMFGVFDKNGRNSDKEDDYIKAGYDESNTAYRVIDTSSLLTDDAGNELPKKYNNQHHAFVDNFRKISSTSVGRTLLYRILLEIRRTYNNNAVPECLTILPCDAKSRNNFRHVSIEWSNTGNRFSGNGIIKFGVNSPLLQATIISTFTIMNGLIYEILNYPKTDDIGLFHEMLHWYHCLRDIKRVNIEVTAHNGKINLHGTRMDTKITEIYFANHYWPGSSTQDWKGSALPWVTKFDKNSLVVNFEEIRTILGVSNKTLNYVNGDDLSENLYRLCVKQPLRFGHSRFAFFESKDVISKVLQTINDNQFMVYGINSASPIVKREDCSPEPFSYDSSILINGINGCKFPVLGVNCIK